MEAAWIWTSDDPRAGVLRLDLRSHCQETNPELTNPHQRVLIVDDEAPLRKALRTSLSAKGFVTEEARSGEEALEVFAKSHSDAILLDINLPGLSGVETCRRLRATGTDAAIVMVTVRDTEDDMVQALEAGA